MKKIIFSFFVISLLAGLYWCSRVSNQTCDIDNWKVCPIIKTWNVVDNSDITVVSNQIMNALKNKNIELLSQFVSQQWVRLSPYNYVDLKQDLILKKSDLENIWESNQKYVWWVQDGSGLPIDLTFKEYFAKYIYDVDFANAPQKLVNKKVTRWNMINNVRDVYVGKYFIEYYFSWFNPEYEWMDWRSLILVFDKVDNEWKLLWIVHAQRTT